MGPAPSLDLKDLTIKLAALLLVSSGQRVQTLQHLNIDQLTLNQSQAKFMITSKLKHTTDKGTAVVFRAYPHNINLCAVAHLHTYLQVTRPLRSTSQLFISYQRPHGPVVTQSISRWIKTMLAAAGIDLTDFGPHSIRASSSAAAKRGGAKLDTILKAGSWSSSNTFTTWYDKPIIDQGISFQEAVLNSHTQ